MGDNGRLLIGDKGFMLGGNQSGPGGIFPESCAQAAKEVQKTIPRVDDHYREWIGACKGGKPAGSNFNYAGPLAESVLLGNVALRVQLRQELTLYKLLWDSANLRVSNLPEANPFLKRDYREGWTI